MQLNFPKFKDLKFFQQNAQSLKIMVSSILQLNTFIWRGGTLFLQPEMEVVISVQESLLEGTQIDQGNLMTLTIESLYSPPESWTMTGSQYAYAAALPIPMSADVSERVIIIEKLLEHGK